jgi:alpha-ketoglutarate-dependent taurine dioxygenase
MSVLLKSRVRSPSEYRCITVAPLTGAMGAEIRGVDLARPLDRDTREEILAAFQDYLVVYFPDQPLDNEQHQAFAKIFGKDLMRIPQLTSLADCPDVQIVAREAAETETYVVGGNWHTDSTWMDKPPLCVVMRAVEVPDYGGDTAFSNQYLAYEMLSQKLKDLLGQLSAVHSASFLFGSAYLQRKKRYNRAFVDPELGDREHVHPVVCTHPASGRPFLYVNRIFVKRFDGMTEAESKPLLEFLFEHADRPEFGCRVRWRKDQVLVWDNRATHHKAIADYPGAARQMLRVTVEGPPPVA